MTNNLEEIVQLTKEIRSLYHQMIDEFPRIPEDTSSDIIVQDFIRDIRIWSKKWLGK
jgi:hypothetical protein